jgi:hypothetical protein
VQRPGVRAFRLVLLLKPRNFLCRKLAAWQQPGGSQTVERESKFTVQADIHALAVALLGFDCGNYLFHLIPQSHGLGEATALRTATYPESHALPGVGRGAVVQAKIIFWYVFSYEHVRL